MDYSDHAGLWKNELDSWVPRKIFDAHIHLGRQEDVREAFSPERLKTALSSYSHMDFSSMACRHEKLYSGREITGAFVFPFPLYEVDFEAANDYIIDLMKAKSYLHGFMWTDPADIGRNINIFRKAERQGAGFTGVKPYFDILRKDNFKTEMNEILPEKLLDFINSESLVIMLHTTGKGIGERKVRDFISSVTDKYPKIKIILAHMGRFLAPNDFEQFMQSELPANPAVWLDTSSATMPEVYRMAFSDKTLWEKMLFGSDIPFGLITGTEFWSETAGAIFRTRDRYTWSEAGSYGHNDFTYNTYHVIKALKDTVENLNLDSAETDKLKQKIFHRNALSLLKQQDF
jgi:hypothetical protein